MVSDDWNGATNLLCVRLDALGDLVMTTPALRALKEAVPGRRLTLLTSPAGACAASLLPMIDDVMVYEAPWMKASRPRADSAADRHMAAQLRDHLFDGAAIFTVYSQNPLPSAFLCHLADIPRRVAYCRENPYQLLTDWLPEVDAPDRMRHEVRRQLDLSASIGAITNDERLTLQVPPGAWREAEMLLTERDLCAENWVLVHPGASAASRRYPEEGFAAVARELTEKGDYEVVFTGSAAEAELVQRIQRLARTRSHNLAGRLNLAALTALIAQAPLLITNNTAPAHLAAAMGTPVVDLYALTNPQHTPWAVAHRVLYHDVACKHCYKSVCPEGHHDCLRRVSPSAVLRAAYELLTERRAMSAAEA